MPELPGLGSPAIEPRALKEPLAIHSEYTPYRSFLNANQAQRKAGTNNFVSQERIVKVEGKYPFYYIFFRGIRKYMG